MIPRWVCRFVVSNSLDAGRPPPAWASRRLERDADLRRFAGRVARVDRALASALPAPDDASPFLASRVRAAIDADVPAAGAWRYWWRPLGGAALCAVALVGVFVAVRVLHPPTAPQTPVADRPVAAENFVMLWRPASPAKIAASLGEPVRIEAEQLLERTLQDAEALVRTVASRLPVLPR